jgi:hypothetical protein
MSTKFEQLLDYIVNEEMDKANELFHEIVVEKSRTIYENLIADEDEVEEGHEMSHGDDLESIIAEFPEGIERFKQGGDMGDDLYYALYDYYFEEMPYGVAKGRSGDPKEWISDRLDQDLNDMEAHDTDEFGESELEDSYTMDEGDEEMGPPEETDDLAFDIDATGEEEPDADASPEEKVRFSIQQAMDELRAAFDASNELGGETDGDFGDEEFGDEEADDEELEMGMFEGRRLREYTEKVGNDWEKNSQKSQAQHVGAGTGDTEGAPTEGKSPIASGKNKPGPAGVGAGNIAQTADEGQSNTGTSPGKVNNGVTRTAGEKFASGNGNVPGGKMGVKNLSKVAGGHGAEKKGAAPGPVGSGTGDKAGQTSIDPATKKSFLKPYSK